MQVIIARELQAIARPRKRATGNTIYVGQERETVRFKVTRGYTLQNSHYCVMRPPEKFVCN
jgi:hypothetical protein